jgi:uncharacterized protein
MLFGNKSKKDAAFFAAFVNHAAQSVEAAKLIARMFDELKPATNGSGAYRAESTGDQPAFAELLRTLADAIKTAETKGDTITHETMKSLHANWITPLDRNDIHQLISRMDDVLDFIEAAAERIVLFEVRSAPPEAREVAGILLRSCEALATAVGLLVTMKNAPTILELCVEVNRLENMADAVHRKAIAALFQPGNDPLMVMKWRDILDSMESAADRCEDVANIIEGVVLEYA